MLPCDVVRLVLSCSVMFFFIPTACEELTVRLEMLESHTTNARIEAILEKGVVHLKGDVPSAAQIRAVEERKDHEWKERLSL